MSIPYVEEWNLAIAKELPRSMAWEMSYAGNPGIHMWAADGANQPLTYPVPTCASARQQTKESDFDAA